MKSKYTSRAIFGKRVILQHELYRIWNKTQNFALKSLVRNSVFACHSSTSEFASNVTIVLLKLFSPSIYTRIVTKCQRDYIIDVFQHYIVSTSSYKSRSVCLRRYVRMGVCSSATAEVVAFYRSITGVFTRENFSTYFHGLIVRIRLPKRRRRLNTAWLSVRHNVTRPERTSDSMYRGWHERRRAILGDRLGQTGRHQ